MVSLVLNRADIFYHLVEVKKIHISETSIEGVMSEVGPIETGVDMELEEYEADASAGDTVEVGIDPRSALIVEEEMVELAREDSSDLSGTRDGSVRSFKDILIDLDDVVRDFYHHMYEVHIDRIVGIETAQRRLEADQR
ncbi:hypothetical protein Tco_0601317 [Tanacetum coccineum]